MKILFVTHPYPNYMPDLLLHGLRKLLGDDVVDFPKKECLYQGVLGLGVCPPDQLCPGWFPQDSGRIDREEIDKKINRRFFDLIICDARAEQFIKSRISVLPSQMAILDGEDTPGYIPAGRHVICRRETDGSDFSVPLPMALPEEILQWISSYDSVPKQYSIGFLGCASHGRRPEIIKKLQQLYPDSLFQASAIPSDADPSPAGRLSRDEYYQNLQKCRIVLSMCGAGFDTFRFWEHAACNAIHFAERMPLFIPNNFRDGKHIVKFEKFVELRKSIDHILEKDRVCDQMKQNSRHHLVNYHLTTERAKYFLDRVKRACDR